jgi:hypothetical protein
MPKLTFNVTPSLFPKLKQLANVLFCATFLSGCNMTPNNEFTWTTSKCGPKGYPLKILSGKLYFKDENMGLSLASGAVNGTWGQEFGRRSHVEAKLPDRFDITFYSYAENQSYRGEFELPYDKILALFQWGEKNATRVANEKKPLFSNFIVGVAPGGTVAIWIKGHQEKREVFFGKAEKINLVLDYVFDVPFADDNEADQFYREVLVESMDAERLKKMNESGLPLDVWQRYRKRYDWQMELSVAAKFDDISMGFVNGERFDLNERNGLDYKMPQHLHVPASMFFRVNDEPYEFRFDDYETIEAFEALDAIEGLTEEEKLIHIEISPRVDQVTSTVRLYNAKHSIELKKTLFVP